VINFEKWQRKMITMEIRENTVSKHESIDVPESFLITYLDKYHSTYNKNLDSKLYIEICKDLKTYIAKKIGCDIQKVFLCGPTTIETYIRVYS